MNVYQKIQKVRVELQKLNLKKGGKNNFANFNYYQLDDFMPALNQLMLSENLTTMFNIEDKIATLTVIDCDKPEDVVVFTSPIASADIKGSTPIQCLGGIHTYMKRYLYQNAFEIVEPDLLDALVKSGKLAVADNDTEQPPQPKEAPKVFEVNGNAKPKDEVVAHYQSLYATREQVDFLNSLGDSVTTWILNYYKVPSLFQLTKEDAQGLIDKYKEKQAKRGNK